MHFRHSLIWIFAYTTENVSIGTRFFWVPEGFWFVAWVLLTNHIWAGCSCRRVSCLWWTKEVLHSLKCNVKKNKQRWLSFTCTHHRGASSFNFLNKATTPKKQERHLLLPSGKSEPAAKLFRESRSQGCQIQYMSLILYKCVGKMIKWGGRGGWM